MQHIIITDDDPCIQDVFRLILERAGYVVTIYPNGDNLLNNQFLVPDIFILDKQLSGMDGLDLCRHLKAQECTKNVPVIVISASPNIHEQAIAAGASGTLEKPFKMKELLDIVSRHILEDTNPGMKSDS